ncbi:MAG: hypothetical protein N4A53_13365 [Pelagimonas sp.]|jgi:hypothetical protein|nr:hypothetical protein [Pelagimonas sp.]
MKIRHILLASVMTLTPVLAAAQCSTHVKQAMSCEEGLIYDYETTSCVKPTG